VEKLDRIKDISEIVYNNDIIFSKKLKTYYKENGFLYKFSYKTIIDCEIIEGIDYDDYLSSKLYFVALADNEKNSNVVLSLQSTSNKNIIYKQIIYPPQYPGVIYPHFLLKNEKALFQGMKPTN
jgi:hypothetical protein